MAVSALAVSVVLFSCQQPEKQTSTIEEKIKISDYFNSLDNLITFHQRKHLFVIIIFMEKYLTSSPVKN